MPPGESEPEHDRLYVPEIDSEDLIAVAFSQIALYGAGDLRVGIRLQEAFRSLSLGERDGCSEIVRRHAKRALELARKRLDLESDYELLAESSREPVF